MAHNREIQVMKRDLIAKIKENKENHIKEFQQAVEDYKKEAQLQLSAQTERLNKGELSLELKLITPINNSEKYEETIKMFEWDVNEAVTLTQHEFNEYVLDKTPHAIQALHSNTFYKGKFN